MKKLINNAVDFVPEVIDGIVRAYGSQLEVIGHDKRVIANKTLFQDKVGIVTAGGSGHLPVFLGYVGQGMLDACAIGNVFASPSASNILAAIKRADTGKGVLCLYGNYGGDALNFNIACEMAEAAGIETVQVLVKDDIASRPITEKDSRRGVAGMVYAFKIAGAAASIGKSLNEVSEITQKALDNIWTMGVALSPCTIPEVGKETFVLPEGEMELGMGIHGEPGIERSQLMSADKTIEAILDRLYQEVTLHSGDTVSVMVNGLGATPLEELLIVYRRVHADLSSKGVKITLPHIGEYATSMEMAGCSITIFKLNGDLQRYLLAPAKTPFYTNCNFL